jgi:hypothetical protein
MDDKITLIAIIGVVISVGLIMFNMPSMLGIVSEKDSMIQDQSRYITLLEDRNNQLDSEVSSLKAELRSIPPCKVEYMPDLDPSRYQAVEENGTIYLYYIFPE